MLARIQSFIRGYSPLRSRPEDGARAPGPHVPDGARADAVRGTREALAHWTGVIEHRIENDPILHRIDVAECLASVFCAIDAPASERPVDAIAGLLGSTHLLKAVIDATRSAAAEYERFADDICATYLALLNCAVELGCVNARVALGLAVGMSGRASTTPGVDIPSYAHHIVSFASISQRHASLFANLIDEAVYRANEEGSEGFDGGRLCLDLLRDKGYGSKGCSNFYSALVLGQPAVAHTLLLHTLAEFDLLPPPSALASKKGQRGRDLQRVLTEAMSAPRQGLRSALEEEMVQLSSLFTGSLSRGNLEALRDQYLGRQVLAVERARQLEDAFAAVGLR